MRRRSKVDIEKAMDEAMARRPELKAARLRIQESSERHSLASHQRLPQLDAVAGVRDHAPRRTGNVSGARDHAGTDWYAGAQFSAPLGGMEARALMRQTGAELRQRQAELSKARLQAESEIRMAAKLIDISFVRSW